VAAAQHVGEVAVVGLGGDLDAGGADGRACVRQRTMWRIWFSMSVKYEAPLKP
jgi:hypothetical protein